MALAIDSHLESTMESQTLYNLALGKIVRNRFREALGHLAEALRIAPNNPLYLSYFGYCLAQCRGEHARALQHCRHAIGARPTDPILYVNLGKVYRLMGENAVAHKVLRTAWDVDQTHAAAAAELARMGIRRPRVLEFLPRASWPNRYLGLLRARFERRFQAPLPR